jgi:hypothetical protein
MKLMMKFIGLVSTKQNAMALGDDDGETQTRQK